MGTRRHRGHHLLRRAPVTILLWLVAATDTMATTTTAHLVDADHSVGAASYPHAHPAACGGILNDDSWYLCDPHRVFLRRGDDKLSSAVKDFQATHVGTTCPKEEETRGVVQVHPQLGIAVGEQLENATEIHRRWGVGDVTSPDGEGVSCQNVGILIFLHVPGRYDTNAYASVSGIVDISVGEALRGPLGDAVARWQIQLQTCWYYVQCIEQVLTDPHVGIPYLTQVLLLQQSQSPTPAPLESGPKLVEQLQTFIGVVMFLFLRVFVLVLLYTCCVAGSRHPRRRRPEGSRQQRRSRRSKRTSYDGTRPTVTPGRFEGDACPICLDPFHQVRVHGASHPNEEAPLLWHDAVDVYYLVGADQARVRTFACGHCVCQTCWKGLIQVTREKDATVPIACPICRQTVCDARAVWQTALDQLRTASRQHAVQTRPFPTVALPPPPPSVPVFPAPRTRQAWEQTPMAVPRAWPTTSPMWSTTTHESTSSGHEERENDNSTSSGGGSLGDSSLDTTSGDERNERVTIVIAHEHGIC